MHREEIQSDGRSVRIGVNIVLRIHDIHSDRNGGIDPGITGGIAFLRVGLAALAIFEMPTLELARNGKKKRAINSYELARLIDANTRADATIAWVENVGAKPTDGAVQAFQFGQCGLVTADNNYFCRTHCKGKYNHACADIPGGSVNDYRLRSPEAAA